jgi:nitrogenase molybdenum-iron protein alpha/beta subunit
MANSSSPWVSVAEGFGVAGRPPSFGGHTFVDAMSKASINTWTPITKTRTSYNHKVIIVDVDKASRDCSTKKPEVVGEEEEAIPLTTELLSSWLMTTPLAAVTAATSSGRWQ